MIKKQAGKRDRFSVDIYRKKDNRAGVVFRRNRMLYRINNIEGCSRLLTDLRAAAEQGGKARVIELRSPRNRKWAVEIVSGQQETDRAVVLVWELMDGGIAVVRFSWQGTAEELKIAF
ncbi:MAG TPA: hypothetical protein VK541_08930 [Pedobacter sp.]|uniref:hypothetical protein n=1 Tax=Pedobacter sp. TaxID=1411316 RepID=UPI002BF5F236|nr:hypothetical protein [Pedobacter sp.]HMI02591.1 hypothetical protein [Pedobacter sp.]